jgi:hypothetical protein
VGALAAAAAPRQRMNASIGRFFAKALGWLLLLLPPWAWLAAWFAAPAAVLAGWAMQVAFPWWARSVAREGSAVTLDTWLRVAGPGVPGAQVGFLTPEANFNVYGYGLPLLAALLLASGAKRPLAKIALGAACLVPFQAFSLCFDWLKQVALTAGPQVASQIALGPVQRELVALGYQFGFLALPTLAPVMLWLALDRRFLAALMAEPGEAARDAAPPA